MVVENQSEAVQDSGLENQQGLEMESEIKGNT